MLKDKLKNYKIILASASPRRQQFFQDLDLDFEIRIKEVDEIYPETLQREAITNYLSLLKANAQKEQLRENEILITSDTIVWHNNIALGKPKDFQDAKQILQSLSGQMHEVITSVAFTTTTSSHTIFDVTKVTFGTISDKMIEYYLENYKPYDKAGAYGIQDWIGFVAVQSIEGSYTNVMGLPTEKVFRYLESNF